MNDPDDPLLELDEFLSAVLQGFSPAARKSAARKMGMGLRKSSTDRIRRNVEPDGSQMAKRRSRLDQRGQLRGKAGAKMFRKLRYARNLKLRANADGLELSFKGGASRIAKIHHFGLRGFVGRAPDGSRVFHRYDERELLGFSDADREMILDTALAMLDPDA